MNIVERANAWWETLNAENKNLLSQLATDFDNVTEEDKIRLYMFAQSIAPLPTQEDLVIEAARHLLCKSDELTILQQVEAIAAHPNQDDYIEDVDGVAVWEKLTYTYTCQQFLEEIGW